MLYNPLGNLVSFNAVRGPSLCHNDQRPFTATGNHASRWLRLHRRRARLLCLSPGPPDVPLRRRNHAARLPVRRVPRRAVPPAGGAGAWRPSLASIRRGGPARHDELRLSWTRYVFSSCATLGKGESLEFFILLTCTNQHHKLASCPSNSRAAT